MSQLYKMSNKSHNRHLDLDIALQCSFLLCINMLQEDKVGEKAVGYRQDRGQ